MGLLNKSDLKFDYSWSTKAGNNPITERKRGKYFNKDTGEDVLQLINDYAKEKNITDKKIGLDIESKIHKNLSNDVSTQRGVREWLNSIFAKDRNR